MDKMTTQGFEPPIVGSSLKEPPESTTKTLIFGGDGAGSTMAEDGVVGVNFG